MRQYAIIIGLMFVMTSFMGCLGADDTSALDDQITEPETPNSELEDQITELESQNSALKENIAGVEGERNSLAAEKAQLEADVNTICNFINNSELAAAEAARDALQTSLDNITAERDTLQNALDANDGGSDNLTAQITLLNSEIAQLEAVIEQANSDIAMLGEEITALNAELALLEAEIAALDAEIMILEAEIAAFHALLTTIEDPTPAQKDACKLGNPPIVYKTGYDDGSGSGTADDGILEDEEIVISEDGTQCLGSYGRAFTTDGAARLHVFDDKLVYLDSQAVGYSYYFGNYYQSYTIFELQYKITDGTYEGTEVLATEKCFGSYLTCGNAAAVQVGDQLFFHINAAECPANPNWSQASDYGITLGNCDDGDSDDDEMFNSKLYVTDGTKEGTTKLGKFEFIGDMVELKNVGNPPEDKLVFVGGYREGDLENNGFELWTSDGTEDGTEIILNINSLTDNDGAENSDQDDGSALQMWADLYVHLGNVYFGANDGEIGNELWRTDGTTTGTTLIKNLNHEDSDNNGCDIDERCHSYPGNFATFGNALLFRASNGIYHQLWISSGSTSSTYTVDSDGYGYHTPQYGCRQGHYDPSCDIYVTENYAFLAVCMDSECDSSGNSEWDEGVELMVTDGTDDNTFIISPSYDYIGICEGECWGVGGVSSSDYAYMFSWEAVVMNDTLYFTANNTLGTELWRTDGTNEGTTLVRDICIGNWETTCHEMAGGGSPKNLFLVPDTNFFYFSATDSHGTELWKSNGTTAGTSMVFDINKDEFVEHPDYCYLSNGDNRCYILRGSSSPDNFILFDQALFFMANSHTNRALDEVWWLDFNLY